MTTPVAQVGCQLLHIGRLLAWSSIAEARSVSLLLIRVESTQANDTVLLWWTVHALSPVLVAKSLGWLSRASGCLFAPSFEIHVLVWHLEEWVGFGCAGVVCLHCASLTVFSHHHPATLEMSFIILTERSSAASRQTAKDSNWLAILAPHPLCFMVVPTFSNY